MTDAVRIRIETAEGDFTVEVWPSKAPLSAANFLAHVDGGHLDDAEVYRIVTLDNEPTKPVKISVIQFGPPLAVVREKRPFPGVPHEPTSQTGIRHLRGTLSDARFELGTGGYGFFITMRDEPELDEGGRRNPDGHGFSAFGRVTDGWDTVERIHARAEPQDYLQTPIAIRRARRL
jgi:peptidyl-prolyl cis-trans isomerase A (cyclophilin A)